MSKFMGNNKKFGDSAIFSGVLLIVGVGKLQKIEEWSLIIHGYQLLPLATSKLMGDNMAFDIPDIFWCVLLIVGWESFGTLNIHHWLIIASSNQ